MKKNILQLCLVLALGVLILVASVSMILKRASDAESKAEDTSCVDSTTEGQYNSTLIIPDETTAIPVTDPITTTDVTTDTTASPETTEPITTPVTEPITTPATEPITTPVTAPITTPVTEPITTPVTEPITTPVT